MGDPRNEVRHSESGFRGEDVSPSTASSVLQKKKMRVRSKKSFNLLKACLFCLTVLINVNSFFLSRIVYGIAMTWVICVKTSRQIKKKLLWNKETVYAIDYIAREI